MEKLLELQIGAKNCSQYSANKQINKSRIFFTIMFVAVLVFGNTNQANAQARVSNFTDPDDPTIPAGNAFFTIWDVDDLVTLNYWVCGVGTSTGDTYPCAGITFEVMADIVFYGVIGAYSSADPLQFSGTVIGNGFTITLDGPLPQYNSVGLFGYLEGATISDLKIDGVIGYCEEGGGIAGIAHNSTIINCHNYAQVYAYKSNARLGGIVGYARNCKIISCSNNNSIEGRSMGIIVGGIVGYQEGGEILNCQNINAEIRGYSDIGGICGRSSDGNIIDCFNNNNSRVIGVGENVGGIIGNWLNGVGNIIGNWNDGLLVQGMNCVGGVVGNANGGILPVGNISTGAVIGNPPNVGNLIGCP